MSNVCVWLKFYVMLIFMMVFIVNTCSCRSTCIFLLLFLDPCKANCAVACWEGIWSNFVLWCCWPILWKKCWLNWFSSIFLASEGKFWAIFFDMVAVVSKWKHQKVVIHNCKWDRENILQVAELWKMSQHQMQTVKIYSANGEFFNVWMV